MKPTDDEIRRASSRPVGDLPPASNLRITFDYAGGGLDPTDRPPTIPRGAWGYGVEVSLPRDAKDRQQGTVVTEEFFPCPLYDRPMPDDDEGIKLWNEMIRKLGPDNMRWLSTIPRSWWTYDRLQKRIRVVFG